MAKAEKSQSVVASPTMARGGKREGAGRKPRYEEEAVTCTFWLPKSIAEEIQKRADAEGESASAIATQLLRQTLKRRK